MSIPGYRPDPLNSTSRHNPTAARVRRARSASVSQSNKSCQAFIPFVPRLYVCYCGTAKCQCCNLRVINYLVVKAGQKPYVVLYVSNHGTISTHVDFNPHGMINTTTIMLSGSTCIDSCLKIYVHAVAFRFLGKRWCQRVTLP